MDVILTGNRLAIRFPFDLRLIEVVRTLPDRIWNHKQAPGVWSVPSSPWHCATVIEMLKSEKFVISPDVIACADAQAERPNLKKVLPKELFPYQREAVEFIHSVRGRALVGDAPGVGKTAPAIVYMYLFGGEKSLIVAPANVTYKWAEKEIPMWTKGLSVQVVEGGKTPIQDVDVLIMSYRTMVMRYEELSTIPFDTMIFDEAHALKSNKSQQNRVARKLVKGVPYLLFLTGTAFKNRRFEMFQLLHMLNPVTWDNALTFGKRYCGGEFDHGRWIVPPNGETNTEELQQRLTSYMIRRTKMQVAKDLPEMTRSSLPVMLSNLREYKEAIREARDQARKEPYKMARALVLLNKLRQIVGRGKVEAAIELAEDLLESGEQVVLFAHHKEVVTAIRDALYASKVSVIDGSVAAKDRQMLSNAFLEGKLRVMIISSAGKEGLDLYTSSHLIMVERLWTSADEEQIEARLHRQGQKNPVTAYYLIARGTIDERLDDIVRGKRVEFSNLIDSDVIREIYVRELLEQEGE